MAIVAQANVVQLQVTARKRWGGAEVTVPSPGAVLRFREALLDWQAIRNYEEGTLLARLHEVANAPIANAIRTTSPHLVFSPSASNPASSISTLSTCSTRCSRGSIRRPNPSGWSFGT